MPENPKLATLAELRKTVLPAIIGDRLPCNHTLRAWFDQAGIPRFKANPQAPKGGGPVFYSVAAVEKFFNKRTTK